MTDATRDIRAALDDIEAWGYCKTMAQTIRAVLDKCDRIEIDLWGKTFWPGKFIADDFRAMIADTLGVSIPDSPAGSAGVLVPAGDPSSPPRGPTGGSVGSHPCGGEPDWKRVAVQVARFGGAFHGLSTAERDALLVAVDDTDAIDTETRAERTEDAKTGLEGR